MQLVSRKSARRRLLSGDETSLYETSCASIASIASLDLSSGRTIPLIDSQKEQRLGPRSPPRFFRHVHSLPQYPLGQHMDGFPQQPGRTLIVPLTRSDVWLEILRGYRRDLLASQIWLTVLSTLMLKANKLFLISHLSPSAPIGG